MKQQDLTITGPDYNNGGPSYNLSESIINNEITAPSCEKETRQAFDLEIRFASQGSSSMLLLQDDQNALFSTGLDPDNYNYYNNDYC
ncbi:20811_t:CDS:2 [Gigaspora rosea]|nr:20811_t:CDS:2 [Gigaspora rosea]